MHLEKTLRKSGQRSSRPYDDLPIDPQVEKRLWVMHPKGKISFHMIYNMFHIPYRYIIIFFHFLKQFHSLFCGDPNGTILLEENSERMSVFEWKGHREKNEK